MDLSKLKEHLPELEGYWRRLDDAELSYAAAVDAVGEACGVEKRVLRKLVSARMTDNVEAVRRQSQELADLIESLD